MQFSVSQMSITRITNKLLTQDSKKVHHIYTVSKKRHWCSML